MLCCWVTPENEVKMLLKLTFTKSDDLTFINSSEPFISTLEAVFCDGKIDIESDRTWVEILPLHLLPEQAIKVS